MKKVFTLLIALTAVIGLCACGGAHVHTYSENWSKDSDFHWHDPTCKDTTTVKDKAPHSYDGSVCSVCGYTLADTNGLVFELNSDGNSYTMAGLGSVTDSVIVVPAKYEGKPVTRIGDNAFWASATVTMIVVPEGVTEIGEYAFADCINLTSLYIPEGVVSIGYMAVMDCTSLPVLTLPSTLKNIGGSLVFYSRALNIINFRGTVAEWNAIEKDGWNNGVRTAVVNCSDGTAPTK